MVVGKRVFVVEDDDLVCQAIVDGLEKAGATVASCDTGAVLLDVARSDPPDIALIDLRLPGRSGLEILRELRQIADIPAIIITGQGDEFDEVVGLEIGADDFIRKPFALRVLAARISSVLRRYETSSGPDTTQLSVFLTQRQWRFDARTRELVGPGDVQVPLTATEVRILGALARTPGEAIDRAALYAQVLNRELSDQSRTIDMLISRLRRKLRTAVSGADVPQVVNDYGKGYRLTWGSSADG